MNILPIDQMIQEKHMLSSSFYQAWTQGNLTKSTLQSYAKEYYQHVKAFPTYISSLHSRCDDPKIRRELLTNLMDEEAGSPNHLDLWRNFALAIGVDAEDLDTHKPGNFTQELINHFQSSCSDESIALGVATLYSYESQIPAICQTKIDGLKKWYGITDPEGYRYFTEHATADIEHSAQEKKLLSHLVQPKEETAVLKSVENTLTALNKFLNAFMPDPVCIAV